MTSGAISGVRSAGAGMSARKESTPGICSMRYGSRAKKAPPMTRPVRLRSPPTTVMMTNTRARLKFHVSGETNVSLWAISAPASPANTPDRTNANSVAMRTLMPNVDATRGFSRSASSARPARLRISIQSRYSTTARNAEAQVVVAPLGVEPVRLRRRLTGAAAGELLDLEDVLLGDEPVRQRDEGEVQAADAQRDAAEHERLGAADRRGATSTATQNDWPCSVTM